MANSVVYLNGVEIAAHKDGYTPFGARLTGRLKPGENLVTVTIDGSENPDIPPFGGRIDYLTYAGIYREVCAARHGAGLDRQPQDRNARCRWRTSKTVTVRADDRQPRQTCRWPAR